MIRSKSKPKTKTAKQRELDAEWAALNKKWDSYSKFSRYATTASTKSKKRADSLTSDQVGPIVPAGRESVHIASRSTGMGSATLKEQPRYTGDRVIGVSIIHKSCLQPVFSQQEAVDAASMRR